ncbi:hypothetical protein JXA32_13865 [Candidatus Sumerlaeota bacterium]|nr:hypothetical protein [Candidatus Sumerlaeota bacterium]
MGQNPNPDRPLDVLCVGTAALDLLAGVKQWLAPGAKGPLGSFSIHAGGNCLTAAVAAARLGLRAGFAGKLGDGAEGDLLLQRMQRENINTDRVTRVPGCTGLTSIGMVDQHSGERTLYWHQEPETFIRRDEMRREWLQQTCAVIVDTHEAQAAEAVAELVTEMKDPPLLIADAENRHEQIGAVIERADYLICGASFVQRMLPDAEITDAVDQLFECNQRCVIVTRGCEGYWGRDAQGAFHGAALPAMHVADTTGCGDVFHGAFAAGALRGWNARRCARFAAAAAALKCRLPGGQDGIPDFTECWNLLAEYDTQFDWPAQDRDCVGDGIP